MEQKAKIRELLEPLIEAEAAAFDDVNTSSIPEDLQNKTFDEVLEDLRDREAYDKAMAEHRKDPKTYTHDEVVTKLELGDK